MNNYYKRKVLVTGGCGFIGSFLVKKLVSYGAVVTVIDNLSSGSFEHIKEVSEQINFMCGSITDYDMCKKAVEKQEIVFHLAAQTMVPDSVRDPSACYTVNIQGTQHILEAARTAGVTRVIFSSSAAVYGDYAGACSEERKPAPLSPYGYSKFIGELLCEQYRFVYGLDTVCLRYFNVYDEARHFKGVRRGAYDHFMMCLDHDKPITVFGDGTQQRDFVPVDRVVEANLVCGLGVPAHIAFRTINIATGTSVTLNELISELQKKYPRCSQPTVYMPALKGDIHISRADCSRYYELKLFSAFLGLQRNLY